MLQSEAVQKGVIPHLMRDLPFLIKAGDAGSESGMTKLSTNVLFSALLDSLNKIISILELNSDNNMYE